MTGRQIFYEGRVQGVGFRYMAKRIAAGFEITGTVRNLDDGRVELRITGDEDEVRDFLEAIRDSELGSHIKNEVILTVPPQREVKGFAITQ
jgi:acylphosphatase